eukprot:2002277-Lingulodinium_polyedra.AAC.1
MAKLLNGRVFYAGARRDGVHPGSTPRGDVRHVCAAARAAMHMATRSPVWGRVLGFPWHGDTAKKPRLRRRGRGAACEA